MRKLNVRRPSPTTAIAITALVMSGTGTSYAAVQVAKKNSVNSTSIVNGSVRSTDLREGSVTAAKLGTAAVTGFSLADGSVSSGKLSDGAVQPSKLADGSVSTAKLADGAVTTPKIAEGAVTTPKIADGSLSSPKIADGSVTRAKLAQDARPTFAVVNPNGTLNRGSADVLNAQRNGTGIYELKFDRDVTGCGYIASVGSASTPLQEGIASADQAATKPDSINVTTSTVTGVRADRPFHVTVVC